MLSAFSSRALRLKVRLTVGALSLLVLSAACGGGAAAPGGADKAVTPQGRTLPPTTFPMPPTAAGGDGGKAQSFTLLDNQEVKLSEYLGQVVVLDFWATFCAPCVEEAPHLDALQSRFREQGLQVIGLNVGGDDDRPRIPEFVERLKIKYKLGIPEPEMLNLYIGSDSRLPQTIVFDRKGRIVRHFVGYDQSVSAELESTVEKTVMGDR
jgi:thiol-disulfide isomerase/thioredoxin